MASAFSRRRLNTESLVQKPQQSYVKFVLEKVPLGHGFLLAGLVLSSPVSLTSLLQHNHLFLPKDRRAKEETHNKAMRFRCTTSSTGYVPKGKAKFMEVAVLRRVLKNIKVF
jgi:hypothetical protein